ncbi:MAG TPA: lipoyl domain-containing protein [Solirubrobacterales bacterium]|nr:lipoyl domain-containing protein [Solirubrobacterales bacterium]
MSSNRTPVILPKWGQNMVEATVAEWHKQVGDSVAEGEEIAEISTDKLDSALEAPATGTLAEIVVAAGEDAEVGDVLAYIEVA